MAGKLTYVLASSIARPSKIYPNWDFWFENIPSGNPAVTWLTLAAFSGLET
jgi:hypothetical protein